VAKNPNSFKMANPGEYIEIARGKITHHVKKDYNLYSGGNLTINAGKSVILNAEGGITFGDYEAPPAPKARPGKYGSEKPIEQLEWINEAGEKTKGLLYGEKATVLVTLTKSIKGKTLEFLFKEKTNDKELKKVSYSVKDDSLTQKCSVHFTIDDFVNCGRHQGQYIFELTFEGEVYVNSSEILQVFPVIYVPEIMKSMGWTYSFKSQEDWFHGDPIEFPWENKPKPEDFYLSWALKFQRVKEKFEEYRQNEMWTTEKALVLLNHRITEMLSDGRAKLPTKLGEKTTFGTFDAKPIIKIWTDHDDADMHGKDVRVHHGIKQALEYIPTFEKYYFQNRPFKENKTVDVDDFYGSVASCNFHFIAEGLLEQKQHGIEGVITRLGIYLKDSFDYVGSQFLGYWSIKTRSVSKNVLKAIDGDHINISNSSYRDYRKSVGKGGDFYRYSNIYAFQVNHKFLYERT
jgi:hypothetical protein